MNQEQLDHLRHSAAHLLAAAVMELWPDTKRTIGPAIENGFYYDFEFSQPLTEMDLLKIEKRMHKILPTWKKFEKMEVSVEQAKKEYQDNPYKLELIEEFSREGQKLTFYKSGNYSDLCRGGHSEHPNDELKYFKLQSIAGAYWRGDEKNTMLTRIYGTAFPTQEELDEHLKMLEEAKLRDHRKLGKELKIFMTSDLVGPGLPLWLPNGAVIIEELEKLAIETERKAGYLRVRTPHIAKDELYKTSGHLPYYADSMFPPMHLKEDGHSTTYYLKAMNCPHHHEIYGFEPRSYRDLPLRLAEYGTVYRYEKSGELFGLMRVRTMQMNDAHMYMTPEQFAEEFQAVNDLYLKYFKMFGIEKYVMRFSTHDPKELGQKYVDEPALWKQTENMVRQVLKNSGINYEEVANEAAFYGPKIDVQVWSSIGREFSIATNQVDFAQPRSFDLTYTDKDGQEKVPIVIHRAPLGTHERFIGFLIEHFAGNFPLWLSPVQIKILTVSEKHGSFAKKLQQEFLAHDFRVALDDSNETLGNKIRKNAQEKIPYTLVIGDKEMASEKLAVRVRGQARLPGQGNGGQEKLWAVGKIEFIKSIITSISERKLAL